MIFTSGDTRRRGFSSALTAGSAKPGELKAPGAGGTSQPWTGPAPDAMTVFAVGT
jgi:hypothetical protein